MDDINNIYRVTPRQLAEAIEDDFYSGVVPYVEGSPGIGKSSIFAQVAEKLNLELIDHRLSTSAPEDLSGLPMIDPVTKRAMFVPFGDLFPLEGDELPKGKQGWLLFLDEFNAALKAVQASAYKLVLDRKTGQRNLHPNVVIGGAGNLATDRAITNPIGTAMQSRLSHYVLEVNFKEWMEDVALKNNWDRRIIAYLSRYPSKLMDFRPDHNEKTFCCPRTWEFVNKLLKTREPSSKGIDPRQTHKYAGKITSGVAVDFIQFTRVFENLISIKEITDDPISCRIPNDPAESWANITHMCEMVDEKNFGDLSTYAGRFSLDFKVLFFRSVMVQKPQLRIHPAFATALRDLNRYLS
jgi:hypothetical protein